MLAYPSTGCRYGENTDYDYELLFAAFKPPRRLGFRLLLQQTVDGVFPCRKGLGMPQPVRPQSEPLSSSHEYEADLFVLNDRVSTAAYFRRFHVEDPPRQESPLSFP